MLERVGCEFLTHRLRLLSVRAKKNLCGRERERERERGREGGGEGGGMGGREGERERGREREREREYSTTRHKI